MEKEQQETSLRTDSSLEKFKVSHESLVEWDDRRRAREVNEKSIVEVMFSNMDDKLEQGKNACNDLLKYVKELARAQQDFVKSFGKLGNAIDERYHYGSLENAVVVLKMHSINACSIYEEHNKILTETIASNLSQLIAEFTKQSSKVMDSAKKASKDYDQARESTNKAFSAYLVAFDEFLHFEKTGVIPAHDPWMAERLYQHSLEILKLEREKASTELEQIFETFMVLEQKRIESTKDVLQMHANKQKLIFGRLSEGINGLEVATSDVNTVADRQLLIKQSFNRQAIAQSNLQKLTSNIQNTRVAHVQSKHGATPSQIQSLNDLVTQQSELRSDLGPNALPENTEPTSLGTSSGSIRKDDSVSLRKSISSPRVNMSPLVINPINTSGHDQMAQQNPPLLEKEGSLSSLDRQKEANFSFRNSMEISNPAPVVMEPPKTGYLFRKSKIRKNWKQSHCVLSSSGYLYIFSRKEKFSPKYTVPLTNVSVEAIEAEEPNVFELIINQGSFFSTKYLLQAESKEALGEWMSSIPAYSGSKK